MDLKELRKRSRMLRKDRMMSDFFRYLKRHRQKDLLRMQKDQLFKKSEGSDGVKLGAYESDNRQAFTGVIRKQGSMFTMVNTGLLREKMRVRVLIGTQEIEFYNNRQDVDKPWFRFNEDIFATSEWFGLNEENLNVVRGWAKEFSIKWTQSIIEHGVRITKI